MKICLTCENEVCISQAREERFKERLVSLCDKCFFEIVLMKLSKLEKVKHHLMNNFKEMKQGQFSRLIEYTKIQNEFFGYEPEKE